MEAGKGAIVATVESESLRLRWLVNAGRGHEKCHVVLLSEEAKKRIKNEDKRRRIVLTTDEHSYSQFHARKEAWLLELEENPTLFMLALDEAMKEFDVRGWFKRRSAEGEEALR